MAIQAEDAVDQQFADSVVQRTLDKFAVDGIDILGTFRRRSIASFNGI